MGRFNYRGMTRASERSGGGSLPMTMIVLGIAGLIFCAGYRTVASINFGRHCKGYLKNAADANTVSQAEERLAKAVSYLDEHGLTEGFTSILWTTPAEDIGFWYDNLNNSLQELRNISAEATQLEKSNVLMKLRETLLDDGEHGQYVTVPSGIVVFPHNVGWAWAWGGCFLLVVLGFLGVGGRESLLGSFTLIELLVVVGIIAALGALLTGSMR